MIGILGEALIDCVVEGEGLLAYHYGGCALNCAVAASRLGGNVIYLSPLSKDFFGQKLLSYFKHEEINTVKELTFRFEPTTLAIATLDDKKQAQYSFYTRGTTIESYDAKSILRTVEAHDALRYLHVGSISLALEHSGNEIIQALKKISSSLLILFDPNVRPSVIEDEASYLKRVKEVVSLAHIVKLSDEDLSLLYPKLTLEEAIDLLLSFGGAQHIVLTLGEKGVRWISHNPPFDIHVDAITPATVVDTIGAGDTISGVILAMLSARFIGPHDIIDEALATEILQYAVKAASITVSRKGADPPHVRDMI